MGNAAPFLGLSGATAPQPMSYAGTPGPGVAPSPWKQAGATIFYDDGGATMPSAVPGGSKGVGSFNAEGLFVNGVPVSLAGGEVVQLTPGVGIVLTPDPIVTTGSIAISDTGVGEGTYGDATHVGSVVIDAQGRVTGASNVPIAYPAAPTYPAMAVLFASGTTGNNPPTGDAAFFNWDEVNKRLGIGVAAPTARIEVDSPAGNTDLLIRLRFNALDKFYVDTFGNASVSGGVFALGSQFAQQATPVPAGGIQDVGYLWSSTPHLGLIFGTGVPDKVMAQGTWYQRVDATALIPPLYYNVDGTATGWVPFTSGGAVSVGVTPPATPAPGTLWFYTDAVNGGGTLYIYYNDGNSSQWVPASPAPIGTTIPPGSMMDYAGATLPTGWLFANGALVSRTIYAALFAAIGTTYGAGDGSSTFALPDLCGRVAAGPDNMGNITAKGRLTSTTMTPNGTTVGATGGTEQVTLTVAQLAPHGHISAGLVGNNLTNGTNRAVGTADGTVSGYFQDIQPNGTTGGGAAHPNVQPTLLMNKIIKT